MKVRVINKAPEWMEGHYSLEIKGNKISVVTDEGDTYTAKCHPQDHFVLVDGIANIFTNIMDEVKNNRFIPGETVVVDKKDIYNFYNSYCPFSDLNLARRYDYNPTNTLYGNQVHLNNLRFDACMNTETGKEIVYLTDMVTNKGYCIDKKFVKKVQ